MSVRDAGPVGSVVIVGAGQGGVQVAATLRDVGYTGRVTLLGLEPGLPYQRPPLSKAYLTGTGQRAAIDLRSSEYFPQHDIELLTGVTATSIDRSARIVHLDDGRTVAYEHLVLATGASPRNLPVPGGDLPGVHTLRTLSDSESIRLILGSDRRRIVIVGAGFLGLEVAAVALERGHDVTVIEMQDQVMARVASAELASFVEAAQTARGAKILLHRYVAEVLGADGRVSGVRLDDGRELAADAVVVSVGVVPNTELARAAGLEVADGIVVDEHLRSSCPQISAIGDCARFPSTFTGTAVRLESVQNAADQGRHVATRIAGGHSDPYCAVPWFWSNQLDLRLQLVGIAHPDDERVVRGDTRSGRFSVFRLREGTLHSIESVNRPADHIGGRKLLSQGLRPSLHALEASDFKLDPALYE